MPLFSRVIDGFRSLVGRTRVEEEMDAELRDYLETAIEQKMRAGLPSEKAIRAARIELGSMEAVKDRIRDVGWDVVLESVCQDVRYGARMLWRSPAFAVIAIGILALGIGANTAIFSLLNAVMLRPLPVRAPAQLVELLSRYPGEPRMNYFSREIFEYFRDRNHVFSDLTGVSPSRFQVSRDGVEAETVEGEYAVGTLFPALGIQPAIGRLIGPQDAKRTAGDAPVAVASWSYWKSRFNLDPAILDKPVSVNGVPTVVVGVTPRAFSGLQAGAAPSIWVPWTGDQGLKLMGRLKPGVSIQQARAEMAVLDQWRVETIAERSHDPLWRQAKLDVEPAVAGFSLLRDHFGRPLLVLMAVVALLLLIACTNVASMLLARGASRRSEMAMRVALGAGRGRLIRQVLTEALLLSAAGSLVGVLLAYVGADALVRIMGSGRTAVGFPEHLAIPVAPDAQVLCFTTMIAALTGVLFGAAPAWSVFTAAPASSLRGINAAGDTRSRRLFGQGLVVAQVAVSVVLLSAAGLFVRHLSNLRNRDVGFDRTSVLLVTLNPRGAGYDRVQLTRMYGELLQRLQAIPGVRSATLSGATPIEGAGASRFATVEGFQEASQARRYLSLNWIGPKYFETLGTPLIDGRDFQIEDATRSRVAIVNQAMARHYFRDRSPIGKHVTFDGETLPYEIVGVAGDAKYLDLHDAAPRTVYLNSFQEGRIYSQFALRTSIAPLIVVAEVRQAVREVAKSVPISKVTTLSDQVDASIVPERLTAMSAGLFGALGAALAAVGLYGLLAYTVARRINEIGVRLALGATERDVTRMVLGDALGLVGAGLLVGAPIAVWSRRFAASMVENVPVDTAFPIVFAVVVMIAVALVAAFVPARRAARVDPMQALRHE